MVITMHEADIRSIQYNDQLTWAVKCQNLMLYNLFSRSENHIIVRLVA